MLGLLKRSWMSTAYYSLCIKLSRKDRSKRWILFARSKLKSCKRFCNGISSHIDRHRNWLVHVGADVQASFARHFKHNWHSATFLKALWLGPLRCVGLYLVQQFKDSSLVTLILFLWYDDVFQFIKWFFCCDNGTKRSLLRSGMIIPHLLYLKKEWNFLLS